ncbi:MAG: hypothetical protein ABSD77_02660 [Verrucomicrobiota bacterium]|jgi:hypothetical protein
MKINQLRWTIRLLLLNATLALLATGCATTNEGSFNQDFHQNLPTSPNYAIENVNDTDFHVIVHQGTALKGTDRIIYVKQAASAVAASEAKNRGWKNYDLNYIQEYDQGWMHVVVADITRKNAVEKTQ